MPPSALGERDAEELQDEGDVLEDGPRGEELVVLEDDPHRPPELWDAAGRHRPDVASVDEDLPLARTLGPIEELQDGGLPSAGGAREEDELALRDLEGEVFQDAPSVVLLRDAVELDHASRISRRRRFTSAGLALPRVAFITWPTNQPNAATFPPR